MHSRPGRDQRSSRLTVTVSSLKFCVDDAAAYEKETEKTIRYYLILVVLCAFPIVICSLLTFVFNHFAEKIKDEIKTANDLAVKLQAELGPGTTNMFQRPTRWRRKSFQTTKSGGVPPHLRAGLTIKMFSMTFRISRSPCVRLTNTRGC